MFMGDRGSAGASDRTALAQTAGASASSSDCCASPFGRCSMPQSSSSGRRLCPARAPSRTGGGSGSCCPWRSRSSFPGGRSGTPAPPSRTDEQGCGHSQAPGLPRRVASAVCAALASACPAASDTGTWRGVGGRSSVRRSRCTRGRRPTGSRREARKRLTVVDDAGHPRARISRQRRVAAWQPASQRLRSYPVYGSRTVERGPYGVRPGGQSRRSSRETVVRRRPVAWAMSAMSAPLRVRVHGDDMAEHASTTASVDRSR